MHDIGYPKTKIQTDYNAINIDKEEFRISEMLIYLGRYSLIASINSDTEITLETSFTQK